MFSLAALGVNKIVLLKRNNVLLKSKATESLIEVTDVDELVNPMQESVKGRDQAGQEEQNTESYKKTDLIFPSGESLPRCWVDADYKGNAS